MSNNTAQEAYLIGVSTFYMIIKINKTTALKFIQIYMSVTSHPDKEGETLYEDISRSTSENKTRIIKIGGGFKAKIGQNNKDIGKYGLAIWQQTKNDCT